MAILCQSPLDTRVFARIYEFGTAKLRLMDAHELETQETVTERRRWPLPEGSIGVKPGVKLVILRGRCTAWIAGQPVLSFELLDAECRNVAIVQLYLNGHGTYKQLADAFGVHINTVINSVKAFRDRGFVGLAHGVNGPKGPHKATPDVRALIIQEFLKDPRQTLEALEIRLQAIVPGKISLTSVRRVLHENGFSTSRTRRSGSSESQSGLFDPPSESNRRDQDDQLLFSFESDDYDLEVDNPGERVAVATLPAGPNDSATTAASTASSEPFSLDGGTPSEATFLKRLEQESYSDNGGGFLFAPFLSEARVIEILKSQMGSEEASVGSGYSSQQMWLHLWNTVAFEYPTIEASKHAKREHLGVLIGESFSPALTTTRAFLNRMAKKNVARSLMQAMARNWFEDGRIVYGVFYIDEHFLPYYGVKKLDEGWFSSHKKIQKGTYQYFVTDESQNPVFFLLTDAHERLAQVVPRVMDELTKTAGDERSKQRMTLVFDRGGCSIPLFRQVIQRKANFITYVENSDELELPDDLKWEEALLRFKKKSRTYSITDFRGTYRGLEGLRFVGVRNLKTGKQTFIVTNDHDRSSCEIANLMLGRWGQENFIKAMKHEMHIDHFPGYEYLGYKDREVDNPERIRLRKEKASLTAQIDKAKRDIADVQLQSPRQERTREKKRTQLEELTKNLRSLEEKKRELNLQQRSLSKKVPLSQAMDIQRMSSLDFERKALVDVLKLTVYMARRSLEQKLAPHYKRNDIHQVVKMIACRGASLRLEGDTLHCQLKHFDQPSVQSAADALCKELNQHNPRTADKRHLRLQFCVSPRPAGKHNGLRLSRPKKAS